MHRAAVLHTVTIVRCTVQLCCIPHEQGKRKRRISVCEKKAMRKREEVPRRRIKVQSGVLHNLYFVGRTIGVVKS